MVGSLLWHAISLETNPKFNSISGISCTFFPLFFLSLYRATSLLYIPEKERAKRDLSLCLLQCQELIKRHSQLRSQLHSQQYTQMQHSNS